MIRWSLLGPGAISALSLVASIADTQLASAAASDAATDDEPPLAPTDTGEGGAAKDFGIRRMLSQAGLTGSLRGGYWSSNRRLDDKVNVGVASAWLKLDKRLDSGIGLYAEGYALTEDVFGYKQGEQRLREAYVEGRNGQFDYRVGKQIIAWGRTDRLNPTDNLTPRDSTLLAGDTDEDRYGALAAKGSWNFDAHTSLTGLWIAQFEPNVIPLPKVPTINFHENIPYTPGQWAVKLDQSGKAIDWSVSFFDGFDLSPDLSPGATAGGVQTINLDHHRIRVLGVDAATTRGAFRYAGEIAYVRTEDPNGVNPFVKNPFFYAVFGVERDYADNLTVIVQAFAREVTHYSNPEAITDPAMRAIAVQQAVSNNQYDRHQQGLSARIDKKWFNETLEAELAATALINRTGYLVRPRVIYLWTDSLKTIVGYEYFRGSNKTTYGQLEKNRAFFAELRWYF